VFKDRVLPVRAASSSLMNYPPNSDFTATAMFRFRNRATSRFAASGGQFKLVATGERP
jgi:hypothetical protein